MFSGLSSSRNHYGQRVITREADLVTAHEFGHNWGSEHDPDSNECSPSASQVRKKNNFDFVCIITEEMLFFGVFEDLKFKISEGSDQN